MRVLYVTGNSLLRSTTCPLNAVLRELRPKGLEPVMVFREPGPWVQELAATDIPCHFHPLTVPDKRQPIRSLCAVWPLIRLVQRERIELIHCNEHQHYPSLRFVARWTRVPVVVMCHFKVEAGFGQWAFRRPYQPAAIQFLSQAQLDASRSALPAEIGSERIHLTMSGLAIDHFLARGGDRTADLRDQWGAAKDTVIVGTASAIRAHKCLEDFVRFVAMLRRQGLPVLGVIAGGHPFSDPAYERCLRNQIAEESLDRHCLMLGNVDPITPVLQAMDIFVSTSQWETFGMSICEAMACGKPVFAYAVGGNPEAVPNPECAIPFRQLDTMAERVRQLVLDRSLREEAGRSAGRHVRQYFDAPVLAARQLAVYEKIIGRPLGAK